MEKLNFWDSIIAKENKLLKIDLNSLKDFVKIYESVKTLAFSYWGCALAGEVGELCNLIKKQERDKVNNEDEIKLEFADIFIYLLIIAKIRNYDINEILERKMRILKSRNSL